MKKFSKNLNKKYIRRDNIDEKFVYKLLENLPNKTFTDKRAIICVILLYITGCRINELRNFNKFSIDKLIKDGTLTIHTFKTNNTRRIDIGKYETELLKEYLPIVEDYYSKLDLRNHVLFSNKGEEINERSSYIWLNRILKKHGKEYGLNILSHSFRIGYITNILKYYNVQVAKSIVGHKNINTTLRYDRNMLNSEDVKNILNELKNKTNK